MHKRSNKLSLTKAGNSSLLRTTSTPQQKGNFIFRKVIASAGLLALSLYFAVSIMTMLSSSLLAPKATIIETMEGGGGYRQERSNGWHSIHVYHGKDKYDQDPSVSYSQVKQDSIILGLTAKLDDGLVSKKAHFFIDLAANDAQHASNTFRLEKNGWEGLCIEPNPIYWYDLAHRSCTVVAAFVGGVEDMVPVNVSLHIGPYGGIVGKAMDNKQLGKQSVERYTVSLPSVLQKFQVPNVIDYLSLDVEGAETLIMKDFPFGNYQFKFMTVERPKPELKTLFAAKGYLYVMELSRWGETLWVHNTVAIETDKIKEIVGGISTIAQELLAVDK